MGTTQGFCVLFGTHLLYNHDDLNHNCNTRKSKTKADSVVLVGTHLLTSVFRSSTRGEMLHSRNTYTTIHIYILAQSAGAVEYNDCTSAEG